MEWMEWDDEDEEEWTNKKWIAPWELNSFLWSTRILSLLGPGLPICMTDHRGSFINPPRNVILWRGTKKRKLKMGIEKCSAYFVLECQYLRCSAIESFSSHCRMVSLITRLFAVASISSGCLESGNWYSTPSLFIDWPRNVDKLMTLQ